MPSGSMTVVPCFPSSQTLQNDISAWHRWRRGSLSFAWLREQAEVGQKAGNLCHKHDPSLLAVSATASSPYGTHRRRHGHHCVREERHTNSQQDFLGWFTLFFSPVSCFAHHVWCHLDFGWAVALNRGSHPDYFSLDFVFLSTSYFTFG